MWKYWEERDLEKTVADNHRMSGITVLELKAQGIRRAETICRKLKTQPEITEVVRGCDCLFVCFYGTEERTATAAEAFRILNCLHEISGDSRRRIFSCSTDKSSGVILSVKIWVGKEVPVFRPRF